MSSENSVVPSWTAQSFHLHIRSWRVIRDQLCPLADSADVFSYINAPSVVLRCQHCPILDLANVFPYIYVPWSLQTITLSLTCIRQRRRFFFLHTYMYPEKSSEISVVPYQTAQTFSHTYMCPVPLRVLGDQRCPFMDSADVITHVCTLKISQSVVPNQTQQTL